MSETEFIKELESLNIHLNPKQIKQFETYVLFLVEYNKKTNLTAIIEKKDIYLKHFFDSVLVSKYKKLESEKILDIGSGAGFPGVPLKIVFPNINLTCLDSNGKKTKFLEELKQKLEIDFEVINDRAEIFVKNNFEKFDIVTARAVTAMPILAELCIPFIRKSGHFISYKGKLDETLENGIDAIKILGCEIESINYYELPKENSQRSIVIAKKIFSTPTGYPRTYDKIIKKPLQKK